MLNLVQLPYSPYCIVQRRILEYAGVPFKVTNIPNHDRSIIWKLTKQRYYQVPILQDGREVLFETGPFTQVIAKYIDSKFDLGLFPDHLLGVQDLLWKYFEDDVEGIGFKLNDSYFEEFVPAKDRLPFIRHKERKFGPGCIQHWRAQKKQLLAELEAKLLPCEEMLFTRRFLLEDRPRFVDFDLFGVLGNFLYTGHYNLPTNYNRLREWHERMSKIKLAKQ